MLLAGAVVWIGYVVSSDAGSRLHWRRIALEQAIGCPLPQGAVVKTVELQEGKDALLFVTVEGTAAEWRIWPGP